MNLKSVGGAGAEIVSRGRGVADQPWGDGISGGGRPSRCRD
jgi:hypothetical protein